MLKEAIRFRLWLGSLLILKFYGWLNSGWIEKKRLLLILLLCEFRCRRWPISVKYYYSRRFILLEIDWIFFFLMSKFFIYLFIFFFSSNDELLWLLLSSTYIFFVSIVFQPPSRVMKFNENQVGSSKNGSLVSSHLFQLTVPSVFALLFFDV